MFSSCETHHNVFFFQIAVLLYPRKACVDSASCFLSLSGPIQFHESFFLLHGCLLHVRPPMYVCLQSSSNAGGSRVGHPQNSSGLPCRAHLPHNTMTHNAPHLPFERVTRIEHRLHDGDVDVCLLHHRMVNTGAEGDELGTHHMRVYRASATQSRDAAKYAT